VRFLGTFAQSFTQASSESADCETLDTHFIHIMHNILLLWKYSKFYNTPTRLIALIREIGSAEHPRGQDAPVATAGTAWASRSRTRVFVDNH